MKKVAYAILITGLVSAAYFLFLGKHVHPNMFWVAVASCYLGLNLPFSKKGQKIPE